jgi:hypothetical protein
MFQVERISLFYFCELFRQPKNAFETKLAKHLGISRYNHHLQSLWVDTKTTKFLKLIWTEFEILSIYI